MRRPSVLEPRARPPPTTTRAAPANLLTKAQTKRPRFVLTRRVSGCIRWSRSIQTARREDPMNDFSKKTIKALAQKGMTLIGLTVIPDPRSDMPFANGSRGYCFDDNGCHRILSFSQVMAAI